MQNIAKLKKIERVDKKTKKNAEVTNIREYKEKMLKKHIEDNLARAEKDIEDGRVTDASKVFEEWNEKYGI